MSDKTDTTEPTFEDIVARLETIAGRLEGGDVKLEEALSLFEEGVRLSKTGTSKLDDAERKLEVLLERDRVEPYEPESNES
jgi:exodeoxyribonuclease VII small subunit